MKRSGLPLRDLIATATVLTAATIAMGVRQVAAAGATADLIVSGGGAHNPQIMAHLAAFLPEVAIATSADYGIDVDAKEAIAFAMLAHETWRGRPSICHPPRARGGRWCWEASPLATDGAQPAERDARLTVESACPTLGEELCTWRRLRTQAEGLRHSLSDTWAGPAERLGLATRQQWP